MTFYLRHISNMLGRLFVLGVLYSLSRFVFYLLNAVAFSGSSVWELARIFFFGVRFDFTAIVFLNLPFLIAYLLPFRFVANKHYQKTTDVAFILFNAGLLLLNLGDSEYFKYIGKRSTADLFKFIFMSDDVAILLPQFIHDFWYIGVIWVLFIAGGTVVYKQFFHRELSQHQFTLKTRTAALLIFVLVLGAFFIGARGTGVKPVRIITAARYTKPRTIPLLINTPFSIFHTLRKNSVESKRYFNDSELTRRYTPEHVYRHNQKVRQDNVVIIILEGFSKEFVGALNDGKGYTPCFDTIIKDGRVFENAFANGKQSIEALPAIFAGIPSLMSDPYISSAYSSNDIMALPAILTSHGYHTSFFHGGRNGTMGFDDFSHLAGIKNYVGMNEYQGPAAFDGKWGVYDEEFLQFYATSLSSFPEPFFSSVFTLSSHHPYTVPELYKQRFASSQDPLLQSIGYADYALGDFFQTISKMPWYKRTLFVLVADHTAKEQSREYGTRIGMYRIPLVFYHPGRDDLKGRSKRVTQQADIFPSVLDYLGIEKPFTAFGTSVFDQDAKGFAVNYLSGIYQYVQGDYLLSFDGEKNTSLHNYVNDPLLENNLLTTNGLPAAEMEPQLKGILQQFDTRLKRNLLARTSASKVNSPGIKKKPGKAP
ncbi:MAG: sulfatase-like hydrolase/transferase [Desulfuromonadaceae bacterium]|nr:sulfatase-like hydrolase/transferase [Desulfuromonadaceae bacterium]MDD5104917.1 sulfatase-like hydrolase/transferase [Desulfuromonadaceae bacterium]